MKIDILFDRVLHLIEYFPVRRLVEVGGFPVVVLESKCQTM